MADLKATKHELEKNATVTLTSNVTDINPSVEETDPAPAKRKRHRKKKAKSQQSESVDPPKESIVNISSSLIPAVDEALRLLEASEEQMNCSKPSQPPSSKKSKRSKKKGDPDDSSGEQIECIVSPGAQRLLSDSKQTSIPLLSKTSTNITEDSQISQKYSLNSQDLELLKSAGNLGSIYSRSSFSCSVTVTSSSSSSQLTRERILNSHLYSGTSPSTSTYTVEDPAANMSAPPSVGKSREEVEAERKARKAAKAAAKGKSKEKPVEPVSSPSQVKPDNRGASAKSKENAPKGVSQAPKGASQAPRDLGEKITEDMQKLSVSAKQNQKVKAVDVPDFARTDAFSIMKEDVIPQAMKHLIAKEKEGSEKSKAELRAERRAKQEAQRAAKVQQQQENQKVKAQQQPGQPPAKPQQKDSKAKDQGRPSPTQKTTKDVKDSKSERRVKLFSHLYQNSFKNISQTIGVSHPQYHLSIVRLGVQYASRVVLGSNARCLALLYSLKDLIADYETPPQKEFSRGLESYLQPNMDFLQQCRPHSVSMVNALRFVKWQLTQIPVGDSDTKAKQHILESIDQYIDDQIGKAAEAIGKVVKDKIDDNDVILVYACSSLVLSALKVALDEKRKFHVVVVDSLPWLEGREMLRRLVSMGVQCSYVHISAASFVMRQVSKVLLGAHALLANGYVMSRAGSSQVALLAHAYNVPVLVCCETHKFSERVQTDSFVYNELGDPDELIGSRRAGERETECVRPLANWRDIPSLSLLNLVYDVTPPDLVTAVVTERAILPCTSVPVILRIKPTEC